MRCRIGGNFMAEELAKEISGRYYLRARHFWPGRCRCTLYWLDQPLISNSANISGQATSRNGIEVFGAMDGRPVDQAFTFRMPKFTPSSRTRSPLGKCG